MRLLCFNFCIKTGRQKIKKITYIINNLKVGGTEKQLLYLIGCIKKDFKINIFSFSSGELLPKFKSLGVTVTFGQNNFFSIFKLIYFLIFNKTDIYHFFLPKSHILGGLLTIFSKKKRL